MEESYVTYGDALNLGCGYNKMKGFINVDAYDICDPDVVWNLDKMPWPWPDNSIDYIFAAHIFEHLDDYWAALKECARILKMNGTLHMRVPDESSTSAGTYRDHKRIISWYSFYGVLNRAESMINLQRGMNAWAETQMDTVPLVIVGYAQVPFPRWFWMAKWFPKLMVFCANHMRNFIHEQRYTFQKIGGKKDA